MDGRTDPRDRQGQRARPVAEDRYGMPAYADKDGKVVIYFQDAPSSTRGTRLPGFNDTANLDDGAMWPTSFALKKLTTADEKKIAALGEESGELSDRPKPREGPEPPGLDHALALHLDEPQRLCLVVPAQKP